MKSSNYQDTSLKKYYILTQPTKLSDLSMDSLDTDDSYAWREKSRRLQARRWRKIKHQLV